MLKLFLPIIFLFNASLAWAEIVNIGVLAYNGKPEAIARWKPTADYLSHQIKGAQFKILALTHEEFDHSINKKNLDFILTNPGHFVLLEVDKGITSIATLVSRYQDQKLHQFSAVLITRNDGGINEMADLKGKTLAAVNKEAFGGFQLAQNELLNYGIDVNTDMDVLWLGFPHIDLVMSVLEGKADVATVRSGVIEKMIEQGKLKRNDIKILAQKSGVNFPFYRSFDMFPEWPFAKLPYTDNTLAKQVVKALFRMSSNDSSALTARGAGWTIPFNYSSVHAVLKRLQAAPYLARAFSLSDLWRLYQHWIVVVLFLFSLCVIFLLRFYKSNQQLKEAKYNLQQAQVYLEKTVLDRTEELKHINSSLKSEIKIHLEMELDINQGCDALQNIYSIFVRDDLSRSQRVNSVVEALRHYLDFELVMLSQIEGDNFTLCCVRPNLDGVNSPLCLNLAQQVIRQKKSFYSDKDEQWQEYLSCPIFLNGRLSYILELASSNSFTKMQHTQGESKLSHNILYLIAHWVGYEALSVALEQKENNKHNSLKHRFETVTAREREVINLLVQGETNKGMARLLNLSVKTIEMHRANALRKTEAKSSTEIVQMAVLSGLFEET